MAFGLDRSMQVLQATPGTLRALLGGLDERWTLADEGEGTFTAFDGMGHLIDGEETDWMPRARIILSGAADRTFEPFDRFRHRERNAGRSLASLLDEFERLRQGNLGELSGWELSESQLERTGTHPSLGTVTLRQLIAAWVVHDLGHLAQLSRVLAKQYREAIGPWAEYLPVVNDRPR